MRADEDQMRHALEVAGVGYWEWDVASDKVAWSPQLFVLFGIDPEGFEATYQAWADTLHPEDAERVQEVVGTTFAGANEYTVSHRIVRPSGEVRWVHSTGRVERNGDEMVRLFGIAQDVTDQKEAEAAQQAREEFFRMSPDLVTVATTGGELQQVNEAWTKVLGWPIDELTGRSFFDLVHPDDLEATQAEAARLAEGEHVTVDFTNRYRHKDGDYRWLRWSSTARGNTLYAVARDVTQARERDDRFAALLESAPDAIIIVDEAGKILIANDRTQKVFGYTREELEGKAMEVLVPQRFRKGHGAHRARYQKSPKVRPMGADLELFAVRKDGSEFPVEISLSPVRTPDGMTITAIIRDITERREGEAARSIAMQQELEIQHLEQLNQMRADLLNIMAHELNTPLTPLRLQLHRLADPTVGPLDPGQRKAVTMLQRNVERMVGLVADILDVARLEAGRLDVLPVPVDVAGLLAEVAETFEEQARSKNIELKVEAPGAAIAMADPRRVSQVLYNLIGNAFKFTPKEGHVRVSVHVDDDIEVAVKDDGVGLAPADLATIFEPFTRFHEEVEGTGLGLFICKGIVEQHGGTITCRSKGEGHGVTFTFTLPRAPAEAEPVQPADQVTPESG